MLYSIFQALFSLPTQLSFDSCAAVYSWAAQNKNQLPSREWATPSSAGSTRGTDRMGAFSPFRQLNKTAELRRLDLQL